MGNGCSRSDDPCSDEGETENASNVVAPSRHITTTRRGCSLLGIHCSDVVADRSSPPIKVTATTAINLSVEATAPCPSQGDHEEIDYSSDEYPAAQSSSLRRRSLFSPARGTTDSNTQGNVFIVPSSVTEEGMVGGGERDWSWEGDDEDALLWSGNRITHHSVAGVRSSRRTGGQDSRKHSTASDTLSAFGGGGGEGGVPKLLAIQQQATKDSEARFCPLRAFCSPTVRSGAGVLSFCSVDVPQRSSSLGTASECPPSSGTGLLQPPLMMPLHNTASSGTPAPSLDAFCVARESLSLTTGAEAVAMAAAAMQDNTSARYIGLALLAPASSGLAASFNSEDRTSTDGNRSPWSPQGSETLVGPSVVRAHSGRQLHVSRSVGGSHVVAVSKHRSLPPTTTSIKM